MKDLLILAENSWKTEIKLFLLRAISHEIKVSPKYLVSYCSNLNMGDITDADRMDAKRVCKDLEIKNLGENHDLYRKSDTLLLANVKTPQVKSREFYSVT